MCFDRQETEKYFSVGYSSEKEVIEDLHSYY